MNNAIAIIPARGGSKRIPRKNIKLFLNVPIIQYSISAAQKSKCFDEVMVSTEDSEIAEVASQFGASIPFYRSVQNSNDYAMLADVIEEVIDEYKKQGNLFKYICCLLATAPFITSDQIMNGFNILKSSGADAVVPVVRFGYPIQRALKIDENKLNMFWPENYNARSQDLKPSYHDAGLFYWLKTDSFLKGKKLFLANTVPMIISEEVVQDIDTDIDWKIAEFKFKYLNNLLK